METTTTPASGGKHAAHFSAVAPDRASACPEKGVSEPAWRRWTRVVYECTVMVGGYLHFGAFGILLNSVCWPLAHVLGCWPSVAGRCQGVIHWRAGKFIRYLERVGIIRLEFREEDAAVLRAVRGTIIAPNHPCLLDALFLMSRLPRVTCVMKRAVLHNPVMGGTARLAGYLCNDSGPNFIRRCRDALRAGDCLLLFPEGTRTLGENRPVNPFKKGFALVATLAGAPVQTVFIETPTNYLGKRWPLLRKPTLPVRFTITLGRRFEPQPGQDAKRFSEELETYFRERLEPDREGVRVRKAVSQPRIEHG